MIYPDADECARRAAIVAQEVAEDLEVYGATPAETAARLEREALRRCLERTAKGAALPEGGDALLLRCLAVYAPDKWGAPGATPPPPPLMPLIEIDLSAADEPPATAQEWTCCTAPGQHGTWPPPAAPGGTEGQPSEGAAGSAPQAALAAGPLDSGRPPARAMGPARPRDSGQPTW